MEIEENDAGGTTVILQAGDDLASIPDSHSHLLTPQLQAAFPDPVACFQQIAQKCPFPEMTRWLNALVEQSNWELQLHQGDPTEWTAAGYCWYSESVLGAIIDLPGTGACDYPKVLANYYSLVDSVRWNAFGYAGGLDGAGGHEPIRTFSYDYHGADVNPDDVSVWGWSLCGDMILWTADGRGGWMSHETGHIHLLGTIEETINWIYARLNDNEVPEYDYKWTQ
ncbi:MAG: hypothetical protein JXM70_15010 [Pirellulales bacterium]|nr:hypothetical protein [Pirellulales bacterium]